jgi:Zn-dependent M28 family amino/carboxypeptidase
MRTANILPSPVQTWFNISDSDLLFLFNGAEEAWLIGAQAFMLSEHEWSKQIRGFVNLEGMGTAAGGRAILFRVTKGTMSKVN